MQVEIKFHCTETAHVGTVVTLMFLVVLCQLLCRPKLMVTEAILTAQHAALVSWSQLKLASSCLASWTTNESVWADLELERITPFCVVFTFYIYNKAKTPK